jgi:hypothetical protein
MGTTTGTLTKISIFDPIIKIGGTDVGFIGDKITVELTYTTAMFETGLPKNLKKVVKSGEKAMCKFDFMQTSLGNFQSALNLPASSLVSTSIITGGGDSNMNVLTNFEISGTDDNGGTIAILFYKAAITSAGSWNVDQDFLKIPVEVAAISDLTRAKTDQLYRINRG